MFNRAVFMVVMPLTVHNLTGGTLLEQQAQMAAMVVMEMEMATTMAETMILTKTDQLVIHL
jgi:hypothetical protein